jgi:hypothetical protein
LGGPVRRDCTFFFGYYQGFRDRQGVTRSAVVGTAAQGTGKTCSSAASIRKSLLGFLGNEWLCLIITASLHFEIDLVHRHFAGVLQIDSVR